MEFILPKIDKEKEYEVYLRCICGEEIISINRDQWDEDSTYEYWIHSWTTYNVKDRQGQPNFCFYDKGQFSQFIIELTNFINLKVEDKEPNIILDTSVYDHKYLENGRFRESSLLLTGYTSEEFFISKYKNSKMCLKNKKPTWEVVIDREMAKELVEKIENW